MTQPLMGEGQWQMERKKIIEQLKNITAADLLALVTTTDYKTDTITGEISIRFKMTSDKVPT